MKLEINTETKVITFHNGSIKLADLDVIKKIIDENHEWKVVTDHKNIIESKPAPDNRKEQEYYPNGNPKFWWSRIGRKHLCKYNDDGTEKPRLGSQNTRKK